MRRIFLLFLVMLMLVSLIPTSAIATEENPEEYNPELIGEDSISYQDIYESGNQSAQIYGEKASSYVISIPKAIVLNGSNGAGNYKVSITGDLSGTEYISVVPDDEFYLFSTNKDAVTATVEQHKTEWKHNDLTTDIVGNIQAKGLSAGIWSGTFMFNIAKNQRIVMLEARDYWYRGTTEKSAITTISIVNDYEPNGSEVEAWAAAADDNNDGQLDDDIMCYVRDTELIIDSNGAGQIYLNPHSKKAFADFVNVTTFNGMRMLNTNNVVNMSDLFYNLQKVTTLDVSHFNTQNTTIMTQMFGYCTNLTNLNISNWDTSSVRNMSSMFFGCQSLTTLDLSQWNTSNVTNMAWMFSYDYKTKDAWMNIIPNVETWDTSNVTDMTAMFYGCNKITEINLSGWDVSQVTNMRSMFADCKNLVSINLNNWDASKVRKTTYMFLRCDALKTIDLTGWRTNSLTEMMSMFQNCSSLEYVDLSSFDTNNVNTMECLFCYATSLKQVSGLENWNTSNVRSMKQMFLYTTQLQSLNLSSFNTENVTDMREMFYACKSLTELDLSSFNTKSVQATYRMFRLCENLKTIYVSNKWTMNYLQNKVDDSGTPYIGDEFYKCFALTGGNGTSFNSENIDFTYSQVDGGPENPGYLTLIDSNN